MRQNYRITPSRNKNAAQSRIKQEAREAWRRGIEKEEKVHTIPKDHRVQSTASWKRRAGAEGGVSPCTRRETHNRKKGVTYSHAKRIRAGLDGLPSFAKYKCVRVVSSTIIDAGACQDCGAQGSAATAVAVGEVRWVEVVFCARRL